MKWRPKLGSQRSAAEKWQPTLAAEVAARVAAKVQAKVEAKIFEACGASRYQDLNAKDQNRRNRYQKLWLPLFGCHFGCVLVELIASLLSLGPPLSIALLTFLCLLSAAFLFPHLPPLLDFPLAFYTEIFSLSSSRFRLARLFPALADSN